MLLSLTLIVVVSSILVFFSEEWTRLGIKIFNVPGVKLLLPLILASWVMAQTEDWGSWLLIRCQAGLHRSEQSLSQILSWPVARTLHLTLLASAPGLIAWLRFRGKTFPFHQQQVFFFGLVLWLLLAVLLSV